jgi:hypothetical protein
VGVAVQAMLRALQIHVGARDLVVGDVLTQRVARAPVDQCDALQGSPLGEVGQPGTAVRRDRVARPFCRGARLRVEPVDLRPSDGCRIVVAAHAGRAAFAQAADDRIWLRAVPDHVPQLPDGIDLAGMIEDRIERHDVAVDVRQDRDAHRRRG